MSIDSPTNHGSGISVSEYCHEGINDDIGVIENFPNGFLCEILVGAHVGENLYQLPYDAEDPSGDTLKCLAHCPIGTLCSNTGELPVCNHLL